MSGLDDILGGLLGGRGGGGGGGGLDSILGGLTGGGGGGGGAGMVTALAPMVIGMLRGGGLQKILAGFQKQGMGDKAASWVGTGENEPVSPEEVRSALGDEQVKDAAQQLGVSDDEAAAVLAEVVPRAVNGVTPEGSVPSDAELAQIVERLNAPAAQG
jgi:uncharacterized protein YidB (DUF937 family)